MRPTGRRGVERVRQVRGLAEPLDALVSPRDLLRSALGYDRVLSDADVELLAATAWTSLRPAA